MSTNVTRFVVKDNPPPRRPVISIGQIFPIVQDAEPETVFRTVNHGEEKSLDDVETKVVKRGRRPAPKANEDAEAK